MAPIPNVGGVFATTGEFMKYLEGIKWGTWRPKYITMHHTGAPDLKTWNGYQVKGITDKKWLSNLASYYGDKLGWRSGPHFFFTPKNFCVLSPPTARGVHAVSFNASSWGVECVGNFDSESFDGAIRDKYIDGMACLHLATGLPLDPYKFNVQGLHFHRDDPKTSKTCPGKKVLKPDLIKAIKARMLALGGAADDPEDKVSTVVESKKNKTGIVIVPANDTLNVRLDASAKSPILSKLKRGATVTITGEAMNGTTKWLQIEAVGKIGWAAAAFIK